MYYLGIDNGITGGLALLLNGNIVRTWEMPFIHALRGNLIDGKRLYYDVALDLVCRYGRQTKIKACIEECPEHAQNAASIRSMGMSYGAIHAILQIAGFEIAPVRSGTSSDSWQRNMLGRLPKGQTKPAALALAREMWPDVSFVPKGKRVPHTGLIDAALIAEYVRKRDLEQLL